MKLDGKENCGDLLTKHLAKEAMVYLMNKAGYYYRDGRNPQAPTLVEGAAKARMMMIMVESILLEKIGYTTATRDTSMQEVPETEKSFLSLTIGQLKENKVFWMIVLMTMIIGYMAKLLIDDMMVHGVKTVVLKLKCCRCKKRLSVSRDENKKVLMYGSRNTTMIHIYEECPNGKRVLSADRKQYLKCDWCEARRNDSYVQYAEKVMNDSI